MAETPVYTFDQARLDALAGFGILDTPPEQGFDDLVALATRLCGCPVALVSLVDRDRQWFKAKINFAPRQTDLSSSVCAHALTEPDLLVIPDLTADPRTTANPLVTADPHIRFYAGAPLVTPEGHVLGSLCVIDTSPRPGGLTPTQAEDLKALARQAMTLLALRRAITARDLLAVKDDHRRELFERLTEGFIIGEVIRGQGGRIADWRYLEVNRAWGELVGIDPKRVVGRTIREVFPGIEDAWVNDFAQVVETAEPIKFARQVGTLRRWYEGRAFRLEGDRFGVLFLEVTARIETETRRAAQLVLGDRLRDLSTVPEMTRAAAAIVGATLGVSRAGFGRVDGDVEHVEIEPDWTAPGMASIEGRHRFDDFGDIRAHLRRGESLVIDDVTVDPRTRNDPGPMQGIGIAALVNVPVRERGRTVAVLIVHDREPRVWTREELEFLRNVGDRLEAGVARVRAEERQAVLNGELAHRMKNTLAMVQAVAVQTLKDVTEKDAVRAFTERVHALAQAHTVLLEESWAAAHITGVLKAVLGTFGQVERFDISGPDLKLSAPTTLSLSLLLHELATNALKYGALSSDTGWVMVSWRVKEVEGEDVLVFRWRETGGPSVKEPTRKGFGSRLMRMGLTGSGGVTLTYDFDGFKAELRAPLAHVQAS